VLAIDHIDARRTMPGSADRAHREPASKEGMPWVDDLDFGYFLGRWVIEWGSKV
jgi:hypothetical protein